MDDRTFDLLVDGELPENERCALLEQLDHEPGGWRRCALAFLEAQSWGQTIRNMVQDPAEPAGQAVRGQSVTLRGPQSSGVARWRTKTAGTLLAMAASFLAAFIVGRGWLREENVGEKAGTPNAPALATRPAAVAPAPSPVGNAPNTVTLYVNGGPQAGGTRVDVPVIEGQPNGLWASEPPAALPVDVQQLLESFGNQVRQQREFVPVQLEDGRQLVVPVDRIEVVPVSARALQ